jgi:hypothetical protein
MKSVRNASSAMPVSGTASAAKEPSSNLMGISLSTRINAATAEPVSPWKNIFALSGLLSRCNGPAGEKGDGSVKN